MNIALARLLGNVAHYPRFVRLWASDTIAVFGSQITLLALPLTAAVALQASPAQMGALVALQALPSALFSLHAGVLVDRMRKLRVIRLAAWMRGALLLSIPLTAHLGVLRMEVLYAVAFACAGLAVFAELAYQALIPKLVERDDLLEANARIGLSESSADLLGPSVAGALVQAVSAPFAIALDACSFCVSAFMLRALHVEETARPAARAAGLSREIVEALSYVWRSSILRWLALVLALWQLLHHLFLALFVLYAARDLAMPPAGVGLVFSMGGAGFLLGSLCVCRLSARAGIGPTMLAGLFATALGWSAAAAVQAGAHATVTLGLAMACENFGAGLFFLSYVSLRQGITPPPLLGRVVGVMRFLAIVPAPAGALMGGMLGQAMGLRSALTLAGIGCVLLCIAAAVWSPLRRIRQMQSPAPDPDASPAAATGGR
jgi:MFS family permease